MLCGKASLSLGHGFSESSAFFFVLFFEQLSALFTVPENEGLSG